MERRQEREFYGQFIRSGSLAFDVGANHGRVSEMMLELGARVIAVEPNPLLGEVISRRYGRWLHVEIAALGAIEGSATLHLAAHDGHSTLAARWLDSAPEARSWTGAVDVRVTTLERLIRVHGEPDFIKIDVEGYESEVLQGLSTAVRSISFEFHVADLDATRAALARMSDIGWYEYRVLLAGESRFAGAWGTAETALEELRHAAASGQRLRGDVFARLRSGVEH